MITRGGGSEIHRFINENIQCVHGYACSSGKQKMCTWVNEESWGMMKTYFPDAKQIKKRPKNVLCKESTYVQKDINDKDENFESTEDNEPTFSSSFFYEGHIVNVETIEERFKK